MTEAMVSQVLVLEDDPPVALLLERIVAGLGLEPCRFGRLAEARAWLADHAGAAPAALITDHRLPDGTGVGFIREVWSRWAGVPVIHTTGWADVRLPPDLAGHRLVAELRKPFAPGDVEQTLTRLLAHARRRRRSGHSGRYAAVP